MKKFLSICAVIALFAMANLSTAQTSHEMQIDEEQLAEIIGDKPYSPFAGQTYSSVPLWGDSPRALLTALLEERKSSLPRVSQ